MITFIALSLTLILGNNDPYPRNPAIDILHYTFNLELNDTTNIIAGRADVVVHFKNSVTDITLNLVRLNSEGQGMKVFDVTSSGKPVAFVHNSNKLLITSSHQAGDTSIFSISYGGEPIDGLVIGKNKFGDRTFFGDNWPDRGQHWLPVIDHPYDKAKVDFIVVAPDHYEVVATGHLLEKKNLQRHRTLHHWTEQTDVPVKVMTVGVAEFSVQESGKIGSVPITTWVFPQNEKAGFQDFAVAPKVFQFMQNYIGPYPYEKLAHVQSKTRFGGLENASNIFYFENSVNGKREREGLIAHETAHQWFGNSVTENDWSHVWLSEGFATYLAALYMGHVYGEERLALEMKNDRKEVVAYLKKDRTPIIDTSIDDLNAILNTNTYQKAAWVLHMLRHEVGADYFQKGLQAFYSQYRDGNASTDDFRKVMEKTCGRDLSGFFTAWLEQPGHPALLGQWRYDKRTKALKITVVTSNFSVPGGTTVEIGWQTAAGKEETVKYTLKPGRGPEIVVPASRRPSKLVLDPNTKLLFEGEMIEKP